MDYEKLASIEENLISTYVKGLTKVWQDEDKREALNGVIENLMFNHHDFQPGPHGINALRNFKLDDPQMKDIDIWGDGYEEMDEEWSSEYNYDISEFTANMFTDFEYSADKCSEVAECIRELIAYRIGARLENKSLYPDDIVFGDDFKVVVQHFNESYFNYKLYQFAKKHVDLPIGEYMELAFKEDFDYRLGWDRKTFDAQRLLKGEITLDEASEEGVDYYRYLIVKKAFNA